ncbi:MAG: hypothetical protein JRH18_20010 [Deltaproteobacteria bacterium]|nr:hypothetical protein [Deltaproteobacteria bacterium]MBW2153937.1 hypothetical protein [Deltaproteobacteria bacterium]
MVFLRDATDVRELSEVVLYGVRPIKHLADAIQEIAINSDAYNDDDRADLTKIFSLAITIEQIADNTAKCLKQIEEGIGNKA